MKKEHIHISRRVGTVSFYTFLSRVLGLVRDAVLAWAFGATRMADAFFVAFRIPNLLRRFVAEGALTVAFVPVYTEYLKKSRQNGREAASVIFTYLSMFLVGIVILGVVFAPWIVRLMAWGFSAEPGKFELTVYLTRIMFPYIFFISLMALAMGILNSLKRFAAPAAAPILLNAAIIFGATVLWKFFDVPTVGLAIGVLIGGVLQLALQIPFLIKEGMIPRINFNWRHKALKGLLFLMIPSAFGAAVYQVNVLIVTLMASFLPDGSVSYLWYADRVSEFPLGIFAIAVATATLPTLSDHAAAKDIESLKETINYSLRLTFLIAIPSAVGLFLLSGLSISVLFERGDFGPSTAVATAGALAIFALKIPFVSGVRNIVPAFFALRDARTPVYIATVAVVVNAVVAMALMGSMLHLGLASALVISSVVNFFLLLYFLRRKVGALGCRRLVASIVKTCIASVVMGVAIIYAKEFVHAGAMTSLWTRGITLFLLIAGGVLIFMIITRIINVDEYHALMGLIKRRKKNTDVTSSDMS